MPRLVLLASALALLAAPASAQYAVTVPAASGTGDATVVAPDGTVYFGGFAGSAVDFDPGPGERTTESPAGFVAAYGPNSDFRWAWAESDGFDRADIRDVALRPGGQGVVATGQLRGTIDADPGPETETVSANQGLLLLWLAADGRLEGVVTIDGGFGAVWPQGVDTDEAGNVYVTGWIDNGAYDFDPGPAVTEVRSTAKSLFVASYDAGGAFRWAFAVGEDAGPAREVRGYGLAVDAAGVVVAGSFQGSKDFDPGPGEALLTRNGTSGTDGFVARYTTGGAYVWAASAGQASNSDLFYAVDGTDDGGAVVAGTFNTLTTTNVDTYLARFGPNGQGVWSHTLGGTGDGTESRDEGRAVAVVFPWVAVGGQFSVAFDADPGPEVALVERPPGAPSFGETYGFVAAYELDTGRFVNAARIGDVSQAAVNAVAQGAFSGSTYAVAGTFTDRATLPSGIELSGLTPTSTTPFAAGFDFSGPPPPPIDLAVQEQIVVADVPTVLAALRVLIEEQIGVLDEARLLEALAFLVQEQVGVSDEVSLLLALQLLIEEQVGVSDDAAVLLTLRLLVQEQIAIVDEASLLAALQLLIEERIGVTDEAAILEALRLLVEERIGVVDEADLLRALQLLVRESVAARDALGLLTPDAVYASLFTGASGTFTFEGTGLTLTLADVQGMGLVSVLRLTGAGALRRAGPLDDRWLVVLDESLTISAASQATVALDALAGGIDPATLDVLFRPDGAADFEPLATVYDGSTLTATGISGSGALEVVARSVSRVEAAPEAFALHPPFPNPTRGGTTVRFDLPTAARVTLAVYDVLGRRVAVLEDGERPSGRHEASLPGGLAPGGYLVRIEAGADVAVRRLVVLR